MMRRLFTLMMLVLCAATVFAQAPEKFTYQAVVRNASNQLIVNTNVGMRVSVLQGTATGSPVYVETHTVTTNTNGLLTLQIGAGNATMGSIATVDWGDGPYFLKSEIDPNGGSDYTIVSSQQLMSVPYALYASTAGNVPAFAVTPTDSGYVLTLTPAEGPAQTYILRNGVDGAQGPPGPAGINGNDGRGIQSITATSTVGNVDIYTITYTDGNTSTFTVTNGTAGPQGPQGETGPQGEQGLQGPQGEIGATGLSAYQIWLNAGNTGSETDFLNALKGADGAAGLQGPQGEQGLTGPTGADGRGIVNITGPVTTDNVDTYTIHYTDSTTSVFMVTNGVDGATGEQGPQGSPGLQGPQGEQGEPGLSAYDIWLNAGNVGSEADFLDAIRGADGANGRDGVDGIDGVDGSDGFSPLVSTNTVDGTGTYVTITDATGDHTFLIPENSASSELTQLPANWAESDPYSPQYIMNKPTLFSGNYNDLTNKPAIPTVPSNVSAFNNDAGYITSEDIPEIPTVPTNVSAFTNDAHYITDVQLQQIMNTIASMQNTIDSMGLVMEVLYNQINQSDSIPAGIDTGLHVTFTTRISPDTTPRVHDAKLATSDQNSINDIDHPESVAVPSNTVGIAGYWVVYVNNYDFFEPTTIINTNKNVIVSDYKIWGTGSWHPRSQSQLNSSFDTLRGNEFKFARRDSGGYITREQCFIAIKFVEEEPLQVTFTTTGYTNEPAVRQSDLSGTNFIHDYATTNGLTGNVNDWWIFESNRLSQLHTTTVYTNKTVTGFTVLKYNSSGGWFSPGYDIPHFRLDENDPTNKTIIFEYYDEDDERWEVERSLYAIKFIVEE